MLSTEEVEMRFRIGRSARMRNAGNEIRNRVK